MAREINPDQGSPQANLGSTLMKEGARPRHNLFREPDSLARLLDCKRPHGAEKSCLSGAYPG